ncbi:MAG: aminotransferase class III-fold pyridoxal phosphate-dependent enzyme, partial [Caldivirga sp.]
MKHLPMPIIVKRAEGAYLYTIDGGRLIDYCMGFGPLILGHRHPAVLEAVREALNDGWLYGALTEREVELAKKITSNIKSIEMIRFVNTGTEAVMNAVRLARGFTGRKYIVKFEGNYHGAFDYVLVKAGSGAATWGVPTSAGILEEATKYTLVVPYNDTEALERVFREYG